MKKFRDCRAANGVKYCFCDDNLCNDKERIYIDHNMITTDDEDLLDEGSGIKSTDAENINVTIKNVSSAINIKTYLPLVYLIITSVLYI